MMSTTAAREQVLQGRPAVKPSKVDPATAAPFTLDQELQPFGRWSTDPIWVPPKGASTQLAESMLARAGWLTPKDASWEMVAKENRDQFTQVREIELHKPSIRLPKGRIYVSVTERNDFDKITDDVPDCVQTRLDEFLDGPGRRRGVNVYYLKPLCIEMDDQLYFTSRKHIDKATAEIRQEVDAEYRRLFWRHRSRKLISQMTNAALAIPRAITNHAVKRRQRSIDAYQAKLEFERRKTALSATEVHCNLRTHGCTFDEMLALTNPLDRADVIEQYGIENELSRAKRDSLIRMAAGELPWFIALSVGMTYITSVGIGLVPPLLVCDPAFVAEFPDSSGVVMKIGHFDDVAGVRHVEI